jgi:alcohol dehydrogenase
VKAAQIDNYGDVTNIRVRDIESPSISDDQILVEIHASSINPFDQTVLSGGAESMAPLNFPATLGLDIAGIVAEIGANVTGFAIGDRVYGTANAMFGASGAFAEFAAVNPSSIGHTPSSISDSEAASLPTAGISGLQAINSLDVSDGQKVFIHGGAGGAGSIAIQVAKARGAYVAATASSTNSDYVKSLGADEVIDYKTQNYLDSANDYDALFTTVWSENISESLAIVKKGGKAISLVGPFDDTKSQELSVSASAQMTHVTTQALSELRELIDSNLVKPVVDREYDLDHIQDAYTALASESIQGKIVISIK